MTIPTINMKATGKNIARLREDAGIKVRDLQLLLGLATPQAIYKWQHGKNMPTIDNLVALAVILHVTVDQILVVDVHTQMRLIA